MTVRRLKRRRSLLYPSVGISSHRIRHFTRREKPEDVGGSNRLLSNRLHHPTYAIFVLGQDEPVVCLCAGMHVLTDCARSTVPALFPHCGGAFIAMHTLSDPADCFHLCHLRLCHW